MMTYNQLYTGGSADQRTPSGVVPYEETHIQETRVPVQEASSDYKKRKDNRKKRMILWSALIVLFIIFLALLIGLLVAKNQKKEKRARANDKGAKNSTAVDPFALNGTLSASWSENLTAYGMFSEKRCEMLGPQLCGDLKYLTVSVPAMRRELYSFWTTNGPDAEFGGFHGTLDRAGKPVTDPVTRTDKGLVQQARHLWSFSAYYELFNNEDGVKTTVKPIADNLYKFMIQHMLDNSTNLFVFKVKRNGQMYPQKQFNVYANFFAILALSRYAESFQVQAAASQALRTYAALDARAWDPINKGYSQLRDSPILENGTDGAPIAKGQNSHLHGIEALTQLYKSTKNEKTRDRLIELVQLAVSKIFKPSETSYYALQYFNPQWTPVLSAKQTEQMVNHGHNLQYCWKLLDAIDTLGSAIQSKLSTDALTVALGAGEYSVKYASKADARGFCTESAVEKECADSPRVWWVQAEGVLALWRLYQLTGKVRYLRRLGETITWVSNNQTDTSEFKEEFAIVDTASTSSDILGRLMAFDGLTDAKGSLWKASYHSLRSLMYIEIWMKQTAKNDDSVNNSEEILAG